MDIGFKFWETILNVAKNSVGLRGAALEITEITLERVV